GVDVNGTWLVGAQGLYGPDAAYNLLEVHNAHFATCRPVLQPLSAGLDNAREVELERNHTLLKAGVVPRSWLRRHRLYERCGSILTPSWERLRALGAMRLSGASYFSVIIITAYVLTVQWYNDAVNSWHGWAQAHSESVAAPWSALVRHVPLLHVSATFGYTLCAIGLLAVASTIFGMVCPDPIKEASETKWTREMKEPLLEYRAANYSHRGWRACCAACLYLGGLYTGLYMLVRAAQAVIFLVAG
ncbi:MAG: hypothetical protein L6Q35_14615, partial [Phycisphaerales bacterium]|nr:hypothetical protein [Phycisphaerales bacterium]